MQRCIQNRMLAGNRAYYAYKSLTLNILKTIKTKLYKTHISPFVTNGSETWALTSVARGSTDI